MSARGTTGERRSWHVLGVLLDFTPCIILSVLLKGEKKFYEYRVTHHTQATQERVRPLVPSPVSKPLSSSQRIHRTSVSGLLVDRDNNMFLYTRCVFREVHQWTD